MARKSSPSNVAERPPVNANKGVPANQKGAIGAALAENHYAIEERRGAAVLKEQKSMKDTLREIAGLPGTAEHQAYRATLKAHVDLINKEAEKFKFKKVQDYLDANPGQAHVYSALSMWSRMSMAIEVGWSPNYDETWASISTSATQARKAKAATLEQAKLNEQAAKIQADTKMPEARKEAEIAIINAKIKASAVKALPQARTAPGQTTTATPESNYDKAIKLLDQLDLGTLEKVAAWLQRRIESAHKRSVQATPSARAKAPTSAEHSANEREEEAVARGTPKAGKRASKRK
jgi:hypothetical protein